MLVGANLVMILFLFMASSALGATHYLDSTAGDDANDGTSETSAWCTLGRINATTFSPGDKILLKAGSSWNGRLWPKGSGAPGRPIVIGSYGEGPPPAVHAEGRRFEALHLHNQEHWEIAALKITNHGPDGPAPRAGVRILGENAGALNHIYLRDLEVHDVNGHNREGRDSGKCNAGILFDVIGLDAHVVRRRPHRGLLCAPV